MRGSRNLRICCVTATCSSFMIVHTDTLLDKHWTCPVCSDHILEQQIESQARADEARRLTTPQEDTTREHQLSIL